MGNNDLRLSIIAVNLAHHFPAPAAWEQDLLLVDRHDHFYFRFPVFQHLGDRGVLGAEPDTAGEVDADAREYFSRPCHQCGTD